MRVPESLCAYRLDALLQRFRERSPRVRLSLVTCPLDGLESDLRQGVTDLALVYIDSIVAPDLRTELLGTEPLTIVAAPSHPLALKGIIGPEELEGVPLLLSKGDCAYRRMFEALLRERGVDPAIGMEFSSLLALKRCVALGMGISLLPAIAAVEEPGQERLARIAWRGDPLETGLLMVWHRKKWLSPALVTFMEMLRAVFA